MRKNLRRYLLFSLALSLVVSTGTGTKVSVSAKESDNNIITTSKKVSAPSTSMAQTPYMGWSSYSQMVYDGPGSKWITAEKIKEQSDAMHEKLQSHGYEYINIDAGWNEGLDDYGRPVPSKILYPMGFQDVINYVHKNGQKIGVYMIPGLSIDAYNRIIRFMVQSTICKISLIRMRIIN